MSYSKMQVFCFGFFSIFGCLVSTFATITYICGLKVTVLEFWHLISLSILFMAGAWFTCHEASGVANMQEYTEKGRIKRKYNYKYGSFARSGLIILYIMCTIISIGTNACMAFQAIARDSSFNMAEKTKFDNQKLVKEAAASIIKSNEALTSSLVSEKDTIVKKQLNQVNGWKASKVSKRQAEINKANSTAQNYNNTITSTINESKKQQSILNQEIDTTGIIVDSPLSKMFKDDSATNIVFILLIILSITVDAITFFFTNLFAKAKYFVAGNHSNNPPKNKKPVPEFEQKSNNEQPKKTLQVAHAGNVLSIASKCSRQNEQEKSKQILSKSNITKYINEMYRLHEQGNSFGYKKIASNIGISQTAAYKIRNYLEESDVIDGQKILLEQPKALLAIKRGA